VNDVRVEYRVLINGVQAATRLPTYEEAATFVAAQTVEFGGRYEIQSRTITITQWVREEQP
jgi:hypothetical protein